MAKVLFPSARLVALALLACGDAFVFAPRAGRRAALAAEPTLPAEAEAAAEASEDYGTLKAACATYADAEARGLDLVGAGAYDAAVGFFELALKLPGDGRDVRRVTNAASPVGGAPVLRNLEEVRYPSGLQQQTAHYNLACCKAKAGRPNEALESLEEALVLGFDDYALVRDEADFGTIRADADKLLAKYEPKPFLKGLMPDFIDWKK